MFAAIGVLRGRSTLNNVTAVTHFPGSLDKSQLERVRRPLAVIAALLLVVDLIGLGLHLADRVTSPFASDAPAAAKTRVEGPEAVVPDTVSGPRTRVGGSDRSRSAEPLGCLSASSGCYVAPSPTSPGSNSPAPTTPPGGTQPVPVVQSNLGVPALGPQVSVGLGEGSCTGIDLTVLAIGECPTASGDAPVVLELGGSLLGD